ncbi:UNVERIFIED_CONTAM: hypothetical protein HHA_254290 [Hammondia hammondi]|eukprot:XP_008885047.1 hypothetical protein HHA_254290 [Hammondia hammondi]
MSVTHPGVPDGSLPPLLSAGQIEGRCESALAFRSGNKDEKDDFLTPAKAVADSESCLGTSSDSLEKRGLLACSGSRGPQTETDAQTAHPEETGENQRADFLPVPFPAESTPETEDLLLLETVNSLLREVSSRCAQYSRARHRTKKKVRDAEVICRGDACHAAVCSTSSTGLEAETVAATDNQALPPFVTSAKSRNRRKNTTENRVEQALAGNASPREFPSQSADAVSNLPDHLTDFKHEVAREAKIECERPKHTPGDSGPLDPNAPDFDSRKAIHASAENLLGSLASLSHLETQSLLQASGKVLRLFLSSENHRVCDSCPEVPVTVSKDCDCERHPLEDRVTRPRTMQLSSGGERRSEQAPKATKATAPRSLRPQAKVASPKPKRSLGLTCEPSDREVCPHEQRTNSPEDGLSGNRSCRRARSRTLRYCTSTTFLRSEWCERQVNWDPALHADAETTTGRYWRASNACGRMSQRGVLSSSESPQDTTVPAAIVELQMDAKAQMHCAWVPTSDEAPEHDMATDKEVGEARVASQSDELSLEVLEKEPCPPVSPNGVEHIPATLALSVCSSSAVAVFEQEKALSCNEEKQHALEFFTGQGPLPACRPQHLFLSPTDVLKGPGSPRSDSSASPSPLTPPVPQMEDSSDFPISFEENDTRTPSPGSETTVQSLSFFSDEWVQPRAPPKPLSPVHSVPAHVRPELSPGRDAPSPQDWHQKPAFQTSTASAFCWSASSGSLRRRRHADGMRSDSGGVPCFSSRTPAVNCTASTPDSRSSSSCRQAVRHASRHSSVCRNTSFMSSGSQESLCADLSLDSLCSSGQFREDLLSPQVGPAVPPRREAASSAVFLSLNECGHLPETRKSHADTRFPRRLSLHSRRTSRSVSKSTREGTTTSTASDPKSDDALLSLPRLRSQQNVRHERRRSDAGVSSLVINEVTEGHNRVKGKRGSTRLSVHPDKRRQSHGETPPAGRPNWSLWGDDFNFEEGTISVGVRPSLIEPEEEREQIQDTDRAQAAGTVVSLVEAERVSRGCEASTKARVPCSSSGWNPSACPESEPLAQDQEMVPSESRTVSKEHRVPKAVADPACRVANPQQAIQQTEELRTSVDILNDLGRTNHVDLPTATCVPSDPLSAGNREEEMDGRSARERFKRNDFVGECHGEQSDSSVPSQAGREAGPRGLSPLDTCEREQRSGHIQQGGTQKQFSQPMFGQGLSSTRMDRGTFAATRPGIRRAAYLRYPGEVDVPPKSPNCDSKDLPTPQAPCRSSERLDGGTPSGVGGWGLAVRVCHPREESASPSHVSASDRPHLVADISQGAGMHTHNPDYQHCHAFLACGVSRQYDATFLHPGRRVVPPELAPKSHPTNFRSVPSKSLSAAALPPWEYGAPHGESAESSSSRKMSAQSALPTDKSRHAGESPITRTRLRRRAAALFRELVRAEALQPDAAEALRIAVQRQLYDAKRGKCGSSAAPLSSEEEELRQCTFRPQINHRRSARSLPHVPWWQRLYKGYRVPEMKRELQALQENVAFMTCKTDGPTDVEDDGEEERDGELLWRESAMNCRGSRRGPRGYSEHRKPARRHQGSPQEEVTRLSRGTDFNSGHEYVEVQSSLHQVCYVPYRGQTTVSRISSKETGKQLRKCVRFASPSRSPQALHSGPCQGKTERATTIPEAVQPCCRGRGRQGTSPSRTLTRCLTKRASVSRENRHSKSPQGRLSVAGSDYRSACAFHPEPAERASGTWVGAAKEPCMHPSSCRRGSAQRSRLPAAALHGVSCSLKQHEGWSASMAAPKKSCLSIRGTRLRQRGYVEAEKPRGIMKEPSQSTYHRVENWTDNEVLGSSLSRELLKTYLGGRNFVPGWLDVR